MSVLKIYLLAEKVKTWFQSARMLIPGAKDLILMDSKLIYYFGQVISSLWVS